MNFSVRPEHAFSKRLASERIRDDAEMKDITPYRATT
jgi:hypothetical protein